MHGILYKAEQKANSTIPNIIEIRYDVILFCALFGNTKRGKELTLSMAGVKEKGGKTKGTMFASAFNFDLSLYHIFCLIPVSFHFLLLYTERDKCVYVDGMEVHQTMESDHIKHFSCPDTTNCTGDTLVCQYIMRPIAHCYRLPFAIPPIRNISKRCNKWSI